MPKTAPNLLDLLKARPGAFVSGSDLAARLGMTRAAVNKRVATLRARGFRVEASSRVGYRLRPSPGAVAPGPHDLGRPTRHFSSLSSTQDRLRKLADAGAPEGTLVLADRQRAGRGRLGRRWLSPAGGLWYSLLLRPGFAPSEAPALTLVAAMAWARILRAAGAAAQVKWPNDVWVGGRKLAGILTETSAEMGRLQWLILGVGLNVNNKPPAGVTPAADSLSRLTGRRHSRRALLASWLTAFSRDYRTYRRVGFSPFRRAFQSFSVYKGTPVVCETARGRFSGRAVGVLSDGRLVLDVRGRRVPVQDGEVRPVRGGRVRRRA